MKPKKFMKAQQRKCRKKKKYLTEEKAEEQAYLYEKSSGLSLNTYECNLCGFYHLSSNKK